MTTRSWTVVLPVKELAVAKSRLGPPGAARTAIALAMARDVATAAAACSVVGGVLVVTDDPRAAEGVPADWVEPDVPHDGMSAAVAYGAAAAAARRPTQGVVVLASDLPALAPGSLQAVLESFEGSRGVVADWSGVGTALLAAAPGVPLAPSYEGGSFAAHRGSGALDLTALADQGLRHDVDTVDDLAAVIAIGVGPATAQAVMDHRDGWRRAGLA
jgi:2-phospho-L-lactate guanylyltransferase